MYVILSQKIDTESTYNDKLFNVYHYPAMYKNQLHEGDIFVYYQGNRYDKNQRYYFGVGIIDKIYTEDTENYYATLKDCQVFPAKVPIYLSAGGYIEQLGYESIRNSVNPPWQTSIRPISEEAFNYILKQAGVSFLTDDSKQSIEKLNSDLKTAIRNYFVEHQNNEIAHIGEIANAICAQLHISQKGSSIIPNKSGPSSLKTSKDVEALVEYCRTMRMSYSYKPILILALLSYADKSGNLSIEKAAKYFRVYFTIRKNKGLTVEKNKCIYLKDDVTDDEIIANLISNPVRALSETEFFAYNSKTRIFSLREELYRALDSGAKERLSSICCERLDQYYNDEYSSEEETYDGQIRSIIALPEIDKDEDSASIVSKLMKYMVARGLKFNEKEVNLEDSSPYAVLKGGTSLGYRKKKALTPGSRRLSEFNKIVLFCTEDDKDLIERYMHKIDLGNKNDKYRPYCFGFDISEFEQAVSLLLRNPRNQ